MTADFAFQQQPKKVENWVLRNSKCATLSEELHDSKLIMHVEGGCIAQGLVYLLLDPAAPGSNHGTEVIFSYKKNSNVAE